MVLEQEGYKQSIRMGPTYVFVHKECGHRAKQINLKNTHAFVCEHCDEIISKHLAEYSIHRYQIE